MVKPLSIRKLSVSVFVASLVVSFWAIQRSAHAAYPSEPPALAVTSNAFAGETDYVGIDFDAQGNATAIRYMQPNQPDKVWSIQSLSTPTVMKWQNEDSNGNGSGKKVVLLSVRGFDPQRGGQIDLKYLSNGFFNSYKDFVIYAEVIGRDVVLSYAPNPKDPNQLERFNSLYFQNGSVGISSVTASERQL